MGNSLGSSIADLSWKKRVSASMKIETIQPEEQCEMKYLLPYQQAKKKKKATAICNLWPPNVNVC